MITSLLLLFTVGCFTRSANAAYWQQDEGLYLSNYDAMINDSYAEADTEANQNLLSNCRGGSFPTQRVSVSSPTTIYASQLPCNQNDVCVIESGVSVIMDTSLIVGAMVVKGALEWNDGSQVQESQYLCGGYIVVEGQGQFKLQVETKRAWVYIRNNGAVHPGLRSRALGSDATGGGNPYLEIQGRTLLRTWSLLSEPVSIGSNRLQLLHNGNDMGWRVGDRIAIGKEDKELFNVSRNSLHLICTFLHCYSADGTSSSRMGTRL
jgi:uncharacterized protein YaiE (UPF0345 family)